MLLFPLIVNGCLHCLLHPLVICILGLASYPGYVGGAKSHGRREMYPGRVGAEKCFSPSMWPGYEANLGILHFSSINASLHFDAKVTERERAVK